MKPDTDKEMKLFNGDSYKNYQQNSASIHCHSMKQKKKKKELNRFIYLISKFHKTRLFKIFL